MTDSPVTRIRKSAQKHENENPGHVVEEGWKMAQGITEAWWRCPICGDTAQAREAT